MAPYVKFTKFPDYLVNGGINASSGQWKAALHSVLPTSNSSNYGAISTGALGTGNGYTAGGAALTISSSNTTGTETVFWTAASPTWTGTSATSSAGFTFEWVVAYDTVSSANIGYWDYGGSLTVFSGDTFTLSSTASGALFTVA